MRIINTSKRKLQAFIFSAQKPAETSRRRRETRLRAALPLSGPSPKGRAGSRRRLAYGTIREKVSALFWKHPRKSCSKKNEEIKNPSNSRLPETIWELEHQDKMRQSKSQFSSIIKQSDTACWRFVRSLQCWSARAASEGNRSAHPRRK